MLQSLCICKPKIQNSMMYTEYIKKKEIWRVYGESEDQKYSDRISHQVTAHRCPQSPSRFFYNNVVQPCVFGVIFPFTENTISFLLSYTFSLSRLGCQKLLIAIHFQSPFSLSVLSDIPKLCCCSYKEIHKFHETLLKK